jgi:hypothetical protein
MLRSHWLPENSDWRFADGCERSGFPPSLTTPWKSMISR